MSKKSCFRGSFEKQHGKRARARFRSASPGLYHIHRPLSSQLSWKKPLFLTCQILGLLVSTLATDEKCRVVKRDKVTIPIQMQLSQKQKTFSQFSAAFFKSSGNPECLEKKDDSYNFFISEITDSKNVVT